MKSVPRLKHTSNKLFAKWATPNIFGSGKLYEYIKNESKSQHKTVGPHLLAYTPLRAKALAIQFDARNAPPTLTYQRHLIKMPDGGISAVDEVTDETKDTNHHLPNILMLPGGGRTSHANGCKMRIKWYLDRGHPRVVVTNRRGMSRVPLYSPQINVSYGRYNDTAGIMDHFVDLYPEERWVLVGSCFGSLAGLDYFSQSASDHKQVIGGVFDSFQFDGVHFFEEIQYSDEPYARKMTQLMMKMFVEFPLQHAANEDVYNKISSLIDRAKFENINYADKACIRVVYEDLIAKLCFDAPFKTAEEFFMHAMPKYGNETKKFMNIKKPVILMLSADDPFYKISREDVESIMDNPNLCLWLFAGGGHVEFIQSFFPYKCFLEDVNLECVEILARNY